MGSPSSMPLSGMGNRKKLTHKVNIGVVVPSRNPGGMRSVRLGERRENKHLEFTEHLLRVEVGGIPI